MSKKNFKKLSCVNLTSDFKNAVAVVECPLVPPGDGQILVKVLYVGINATDINITAGRMFSGTPPYDIGMEALGVVEAVGSNVQLKVGQSVLYFGKKAFSEYLYVSEHELFPIKDSRPEFLGLLISGLAASISLDKPGNIKKGETVLITAAAGGTGSICVQWAKSRGCHVIGTCSTEKKVQFLKDLGCDRVINYKTEDINSVLTAEYPRGVDVIWESIGGKTCEMLTEHLATRGRMVVIGTISGYAQGGFSSITLNMSKFLIGSKTLSCFALIEYVEFMGEYFQKLSQMLLDGTLKVQMDLGDFKGIEGIIKAQEYLHSGKNLGKVTVSIQD